MRYDKP